jgi:parafibromin
MTRDRNGASNAHRKMSVDNPRPSKSLDPDPSFLLRRQKTNKSSQPDDSEPVSPRFGATTSRQKHHSGGSNKSILEINTNSVTSSLSLGSKFPPNVSDWNEKVQWETRSSSGDFPPRHAADPPRPAREGYEWVWFPEGYWAERERPESYLKIQKSRKWFHKSQDRQSNPSSLSRDLRGNKTTNDTDLPEIKTGSTTSHGSSSRASQTMEVRDNGTDTPGSKIKKGLQYVSLTHPHFVSPTGQPEGLYCKVKRGIETRVNTKTQMVWFHFPMLYEG